MTNQLQEQPTQTPVSWRPPAEDAKSIVDVVKETNEFFSTGDPNELSFMRAMLRCLGHVVVNDHESIGDDDLPPVNPWKLIGKMGHAVISRKERRAIMTRLGEESGLGDSLGLLAMLSFYSEHKERGASPAEAKEKAINWYTASPPKGN